MGKKKSTNVIEPMKKNETSIMDNFNKTNEIINYLNKEAAQKKENEATN